MPKTAPEWPRAPRLPSRSAVCHSGDRSGSLGSSVPGHTPPRGHASSDRDSGALRDHGCGRACVRSASQSHARAGGADRAQPWRARRRRRRGHGCRRRAARGGARLSRPVVHGELQQGRSDAALLVRRPARVPRAPSGRGRNRRSSSSAAARVRFHLARATVGLDADTTYTRAVAAREHLALSRRNALDSDSLLHMVDRRRAAGDASDMDVELARVNAGQQENAAAADSLTLDLRRCSTCRRRWAIRA